MPVILALAAALAYGASDFVAGVWSRRASFIQVALLTQTASTVLVLVAFGVTVVVGGTAAAAGGGAA
ncbi:MAG: EamA family transporter, partial [Acidimicrobiales bacterium]